MASSNFLVFSFILLFATAMAPLAEAQLLGGLGGPLGLIRINGTVFCSVDGSRVTNGVTNPVFANAAVQVQCGSSRTVVSSTVTDSAGVFSILLDPMTNLLSSLSNNCNIVIATPLSSCNASFPVGGILQSPLQFSGRTVLGLLGNVLSFAPTGFSSSPASKVDALGDNFLINDIYIDLKSCIVVLPVLYVIKIRDLNV